MDALQSAVAGRNLEACALERDGAVASSLSPSELRGEGQSELFARRRGPAHVPALEVSLEGSLADLQVTAAVVLQFQPGERGLVQLRQRQVRAAFQHGQQTAFDRPPECLLLAVLIGTVGERLLVKDAQTPKALSRLRRQHRRAIIRHQRARQAALLERLAHSVGQILRGLPHIPLRMAAQTRMIVQNPQQMRIDPLPIRHQDSQRTGMKIQMPECVDVFAFIAAHFTPLETRLRSQRPRRTMRRPAPRTLHHAVSLQVPHHRIVRRHRAPVRMLRDGRREVVRVQPIAPALVRFVLLAERLREWVIETRMRPVILSDPTSQRTHRVRLRAERLVVPALDRRDRVADPLAANRMTPLLRGQLFQSDLQLTTRRRRRQQEPNHAEPKVSPALVRTGVLLGFRHLVLLFKWNRIEADSGELPSMHIN